MARLLLSGEVPVFLGGDTTRIMGRATGYEERGQVVLQVVLDKEAGLLVEKQLKGRIPLGMEIILNGGGSEREEDVSETTGAGEA